MRGFIWIVSGRSATPMPRPAPTGSLLAETARHLAVRMSYEDVIRVAQAKIDPARFARIAAQMGIKPDQPFAVTEFLKPGVEEFCSILPPWLARPILAFAERHRKIRRRPLGHGDQHRVALRLPALLHSRQAAPLPAAHVALTRKNSATSATGCKLIVRAAPLSAELAHRDRRVRPPHQRLRRHPQARQRQLSH